MKRGARTERLLEPLITPLLCLTVVGGLTCATLGGCATSPPPPRVDLPLLPPLPLRGLAADLTQLAERTIPTLVRISNEANVFKPPGEYFAGLGERAFGLINLHPYWEWPYRVLSFPFYLLFGYFDLTVSQGSGFFIDDELVITNAHVVANASRLRCLLNDGRAIDATVERVAPELDLALLRLAGLDGEPPPGLLLRPFRTRPGEPVLAMGFPTRESLRPLFSEEDHANPRLTVGIISAVDVELGNERTRYIETDAALNPGNSGGPLIGLDGTVIGVATLIGVGKENEGYAVPAMAVLQAFGDLLVGGGAAAAPPDDEVDEDR